jgi:hypothetical protein
MREELNVWDGEWMRGGESYRTHLRYIAVATSLIPDEFQLFCDRRDMISRLVAIELCETACLSTLLLKKRCQMGSIDNFQGNAFQRRRLLLPNRY